MQVELDSVEAALATHRDDLGRVKLTRDKALAAARKLKDSVSHVSSASLLADLEVSHPSSFTSLLPFMTSFKLCLVLKACAFISCSRLYYVDGISLNASPGVTCCSWGWCMLCVVHIPTLLHTLQPWVSTVASPLVPFPI